VGDRRDGGDFPAGGLRPYRLLLATLPLRVLRQDVVANVWPLKLYIPWCARWW
jgi:predicted lysophospholipase L1 biosynthesis ABC-type transport system permease subunit